LIGIPRVLADHGHATDGPTVVAVGSLHGDEPAGAEAVARFGGVVNGPFHGRFVGLAGNVGALDRRVRYIDVDLTRRFTPEVVAAVRQGQRIFAEDHEQAELVSHIEQAWEERSREHPFILIDLHTTSGDGPPFGMLSGHPEELALGRGLPVVKVLGIQGYIKGGLLAYYSDLGAMCMGFESGRHDDPLSVTRHEALLWTLCAHVGLLNESGTSIDQAEILQRVTLDLPSEIEVQYRHPVTDGDGFRMKAGYRHFQTVQEGEVLAHDHRGPIRAPLTGYLLMPLYSRQGSDGFFIGRRFGSKAPGET
jgi:succinylglutamate desuccinylase